MGDQRSNEGGARNASFPYAGTYVGPEAIIANVFHRLATEWDGYRAEVASYMVDGDQVAAFGVPGFRCRASVRRSELNSRLLRAGLVAVERLKVEARVVARDRAEDRR